ncbi:MAG TPA: hypothetical protein VF556_17730 [Pyrinomonadaceae bacterium]|jgi:hypothetical protein
MGNKRWRKINQFFVVSGIGKKQTAATADGGTFLADADLDTLEPCEMEMDLVVERGEERNCDGRDLIGQPVKSRMRRFRLTYNRFTPLQAARMLAYKEGAVTAPTGAPANEVQTLSRTGDVTGGTFTISLSLEGRSGSTKPIAYNATTAQILAAITGALGTLGKVIQPGDVTIGGSWGAGITLTFARRLRNANIPLVTINNAAITGGGTVTAAQTTAGDNYFHTIRRSADGSKPHFTFATGDKGGTIATQKYGDAVVESVDFACNPDQTDVQMIVVIASSFNPDEVSDFAVPACVNLPAVKVTDTRIKIAGNFEHRDLVNHAINLNDNVPVKAAFSYDDIDVSSAFVSGDQPTQEFTTEVFGDSDHALHELALNEYVEGNEVEFITHFGNPGNRISVIGDETKIKPQAQLEGFSGEANQSTIKIAGTPFGITDIPVRYEFIGDQSVSFLSV